MKRIFRTFNHWQNWLGLWMVGLFIAGSLAAPLISPDDPKNPGPFMKAPGSFSADLTPHAPSQKDILGTMPGQYDIFHALVAGIPNALSFGLQITLTSAIFGVVYGAVAAYVGGWLNGWMMRIADSFLAFPVIAGVVLLEQLWNSVMADQGAMFYNQILAVEPVGPITPIQWLLGQINPLTLVLILFSWMPYARMTSTIVTTLKQSDFILAARALGASPVRIILRHLIPNAISPTVVLAARDMGNLVILQASFTFIGLSGGSVWGEMLSVGRDWIIGPGGGSLKYWWTFLPVTLVLILYGMSWNLLGDAVNELLDPHST